MTTILVIIYGQDNTRFRVSIDRSNDVRASWNWKQTVSQK